MTHQPLAELCGARYALPPMQLRTFMKLNGEMTIPQMIERLRAVANDGELEDLARTTVGRHVAGEIFPSARLQELYALATERAVMPNDWVELAAKVRQERERAA